MKTSDKKNERNENESPTLQRLSQALPHAKKDLLSTVIRELLSSFLGFDSGESIASTESFIELGADSMQAVDFKDLLEKELNCSLRTTLLFDYPRVDLLVDYLADDILQFSLPHTEAEDQPEQAFRFVPPQEWDDLSNEALRKLLLEKSEKLHEIEKSQNDPIAVIGMGCRLPGKVTNLQEFWNLLSNSIDGITEVPPDRWDVDQFYSPEKSPGTISNRYGGFIDSIDLFDTQFFGISPRESIKIDPQQRILLEVIWETLENAGQSPEELKRTPVGVFVGIRASEYRWSYYDGNPETIDLYQSTGESASAAAGRVSYLFGFTGPSVSLDTACSSSLVALHFACESLHQRESSSAIVGGTNLILSEDTSISASQGDMLSADGHCKSFSSKADGYVRADACGAILLKRFSDAQKAGDPILALIRGTGVNQDGDSGGLTVPNGPSQEILIRNTLDKAGIDPAEVSYIEAHGTGTALGDPIEVGALQQVFGASHSSENPLIIGSVKSLVGHSEPAAGITGVIKIVLALQKNTLPANLNFDPPNPYIPWDDIPIMVAKEKIAWLKKTARIAGVSSFGFTGTNSHAVLSDAPLSKKEKPKFHRPFHLLPLSGKGEPARKELAQRYLNYFESPDSEFVELSNIAYTASAGRDHFQNRLAILAKDSQEAQQKLKLFLQGEESPDLIQGEAQPQPPKIAFLFTGQGSQYINMGKEFFETHPLFQKILTRCDQLLQEHWDHSLFSYLWGENQDQLGQTQYAQPAIFSVGYALAQCWQSWGVTPNLLMGHSLGEYIAACVAGVFSLEDGLKFVAARGRLMQSLPEGGSMVAVMAGKEKAKSEIQPYLATLSIAAFNTPTQTVLSGDSETIRSVCQKLEGEGIKTRPLEVSHAFHSPLMQPIIEEFKQVAQEVVYHSPQMSMISNLTGKLVQAEIATPDYWVKHLLSPVHFMEGMKTFQKENCEVSLEIGASPHLSGMAKQCLPQEKMLCVPSLRKGTSDWIQLLRSMGELYVHGISLDWKSFAEGYSNEKVSLPTYPFQKQKYWIEKHNQEFNAARFSSQTSQNQNPHPLLGEQLYFAKQKQGEFHFESRLKPSSAPFLKHHVIFDQVVFPGAGYLEMAFAAGYRALQSKDLVFSQISFQEALLFPPSQAVTVQSCLTPKKENQYSFEIYRISSADSEEEREEDQKPEWTLLSSGVLGKRNQDSPVPLTHFDSIENIQARCVNEYSVEQYYEESKKNDFYFGPLFRGIKRLWSTEQGTAQGESLAEIQLPKELLSGMDDYQFHPILIDSCFQTFTSALADIDHSQVFMPVGIESIELYQPFLPEMWSHLRVSSSTGSQQISHVADITLLDQEGEAVASVKGLRIVSTTRGRLVQDKHTLKKLLYSIAWHPQERGEGAISKVERSVQDPASWLILSDQGGVGERIAEVLENHGERCVQVNLDEVDFTQSEEFQEILEDEFGEGFPPCCGVLHLWSLDGLQGSNADNPPLVSLERQAQICASTLSLVQALTKIRWAKSESKKAPQLWFITRGAQSTNLNLTQSATANKRSFMDLNQASLWGLGSSLAIEHPEYRPVCLDLDPQISPEHFEQEIQSLFEDLWRPDYENQIAYRQNTRYVPQLLKHQVKGDRSTGGLSEGEKQLTIPSENPFQLSIGSYGMLENLEISPLERHSPQKGEVEIEVSASALNFKDVLHTLGMLQEYSEKQGIMHAQEQPLGFECAGTVVSLGDQVTDLQIGDQVIATAPEGCMRSFITVNSSFVAKKPNSLSFAEAAALPTVFLTSIYGLEHLAKIKSGDRILIHACAGGVGQAALQIAKRAGATVFATASLGKWDHLKAQGVPHVMNSRNLDFAEQIMELTHGEGVDLVLNSLAGEYIPKSLEVLAQGGRFVEIGKIDIWTPEKMQEERPDVQYFSFDLGEESDKDPALYPSLLSEMVSGFEQESFDKLPIQEFPLSKAVEGFRYLGQAKNIGKVVLSIPQVGSPQQEEASPIQADRNYLITGGLGALGLHVAQFLVDQGANVLSLISRSTPSEKAKELIAQMEKKGATIHVFATDISSKAEVESLFQKMEEALPPLAGVVHAAGVLRDGVVVQQNWDRFSEALAPKIFGTWNLHQFTMGKPLDFFVCFSSIASLLGSPGQGNYAAANAFLDSFAHYRRELGLPAVSINWAAWAGGGMATALSPAEQNRIHEMGLKDITIDQGLQAFSALLQGEQPQVAVMNMNWSQYIQLQPREQSSFLKNFLSLQEAETGQENTQFLQQIKDSSPEEAEKQLFTFMQSQIAKVLGFASPNQVGPKQQLFDLGVDSLMAIDFKNRIETTLNCTLHSTLLFDYPTLETLVGFLTDQILERESEPQETKLELEKKQEEEKTAQITEEVEQLSEDEVARALREALQNDDDDDDDDDD